MSKETITKEIENAIGKKKTTIQKLNKKRTTEERRTALLEYLQKKGRWNLNVPGFAKEWNITVGAVYDDLKAVIPHVTIVDSEEVKFELYGTYKKQVASLSLRYDKASTDNTRVHINNSLVKTMESMTRFMEDWGAKNPTTRNALVDELEKINTVYEQIIEEKT